MRKTETARGLSQQFGRGGGWYRAVLWIAVGTLASVTVFPTLYSVYLSLTDASLISPVRHFVGLANYLGLARDADFWHALAITVVYLVSILCIEIPLALWLANALLKHIRGRTFFRIVLILPLTLPPIAAGLMWKLFLAPGSGLGDLILAKFGLGGINWFGDPAHAIWAIIGVDVYLFTPFGALIFLAGLQDLPEHTLEAAAIDGAGRWSLFRYIILPSLRSRIYLVALFRTAYALMSFDLIASTTNGGPGNATTNLTYLTYLTGYQRYSIGNATVYGIVLFALMFVVARLLARRTQESWR